MNKRNNGMSQNTMKTAARLLKYVTGTYKVEFIIVVICILLCSVASISVSFSMKFLLDDYILPLVGQGIIVTPTESYGSVSGNTCISTGSRV